jgi:hypothetical protein
MRIGRLTLAFSLLVAVAAGTADARVIYGNGGANILTGTRFAD